MSLAHLLAILLVYESVACERNFTVSYDEDTFLKDDEPFWYVSGTLNYFNVPHELWEQRLRSMRLGGVNVLQTAIEWRTHEPESGKYSFSEQDDVVKFIQLAQQIGFLVNVQIGPFIDSNRDMGGLPWWLLSSPPMKLRSSDPRFLSLVDRWFSVLLPKLRPLLYRSGGPIILVQVENRYGSFGLCDRNYTGHLLATAEQYLGDETVFVTTDVPTDDALKCGQIEGCLATVTFGPSVDANEAVRVLQRHQPKGPLVNSGFLTAAADEWGRMHHTQNETKYANELDTILSLNMSVNIAPFHGGSNWYFDSGARINNGTFSPFTTSSGMDAPLDEAGDPTPKFRAVKEIIKKFLPDVPDENPTPSRKMSIEPIQTPLLFDFDYLITHMEEAGLYKTSPAIQPMESFAFDYGLVVYSTRIATETKAPVVVTINDIRDRGYVYLDGELNSIVDRAQNSVEVTLHPSNGSRLDIAVENQGRVSSDADMFDRKGLIGNVTIGGKAVGPWKVFQMARTRADLERANKARNITRLPEQLEHEPPKFCKGLGLYGNFFILKEAARDTYLKLNNFTKGYAWLNGHHLGRSVKLLHPSKVDTFEISCAFREFGGVLGRKL